MRERQAHPETSHNVSGLAGLTENLNVKLSPPRGFTVSCELQSEKV